MDHPPSALATALEGRYRFEPAGPDGSCVLGQGGMAVVYAAWDLKLGREVALKVFREELARQIGPERFLREIRIAATLSHPHIVPLYDSGADAGQLFYVMPRIRGETLRQRLDRERMLPVAEALAIAREVADALDYAHQSDVLHRDIKPENILLANGHARVADFGVARSISGRDTQVESDGALTGTGLAIGTLEYMSPEQRAGTRELDGRSDIFSLGCVLFEMLTGDAPALPAGARHAGADSDPVLNAMHVARPELSSTLDPVIQRALAARPDDRFATAAELGHALGRVRLRRTPTARSVFALATIATALLGFWLWRRAPAPPAARAEVLVGDFEGPPGDAILPRIVSELVSAELNQSTRLVTVAPEQLNAARRSAGLADEAPLGVERARELATRLSVRAVVTGSIRPLGSTNYAVIVRAVDPEAGKDLAVYTAAATDSNLVLQVGTLARQLRLTLGERQHEITATRPVWDVSTRSFPAYRKYVEALHQFNRGEVAAAVTLLQEAVGLDSAFASAWSALGSSLFYQRDADAARTAFAMARRHAGHLSDLGRYRLEADIATLEADPARAIHWFDLALQLDPTCVPALNNRALAHAGLGRYEDALADLSRAVHLTSFGAYQGQIELLNEAATLIILDSIPRGKAVARALQPAYAEYISLMVPVAEGNWAVADSLARLLQESPGSLELVRSQARLILASAQAARGEIGAARVRLTQLATRSPRDARSAARAELLLCAAAECRIGPVPRQLRNDPTPPGRIVRGMWLAASGDTVAAGAELRGVERLDSSALRRLGAGVPMLRASLDVAGGRWRAVTELLAPAAFAGEHDVLDPDRVSTQAMRWVVADAYTRQGRGDSAAAYFTLLTRPVRVPAWSFAFHGFTASAARRRLALLAQHAGKNDQAARWQGEFLQAFVRPDEAYRAWRELP